MEWCEHLIKGESFYNKHLDPYSLVFKGEHWKFCPICGAPRPKEKSLQEKIDSILMRHLFRSEIYTTHSVSIELTRIAEEHFLQKKS